MSKPRACDPHCCRSEERARETAQSAAALPHAVPQRADGGLQGGSERYVFQSQRATTTQCAGTDILVADPQLAREVEYDLRRYEEEQQQLQRQRLAAIHTPAPVRRVTSAAAGSPATPAVVCSSESIILRRVRANCVPVLGEAASSPHTTHTAQVCIANTFVEISVLLIAVYACQSTGCG